MIRAAKSADLPGLAQLHRASILALCSVDYTTEQLTEWTSVLRVESYSALLTTHTLLVSERDGELEGFGVVDPRIAFVHATYVDPGAARHGVGRSLMLAMEQSARGHGAAEVQLHATLNAVSFYEKCGYAQSGPGSNRLPSGVELPCIKMHKRLDGP